MPTIRKTEIEDIVARLPELEPLDSSFRDSQADLFVGAYGFEDRCTAIPLALNRDNVKHSVFIKYSCNVDDNSKSRTKLVEHFGTESITEIGYDKTTIDNELATAFDNLTSAPNRVFIDVSALASFAIYPIMDCVFERLSNSSLTIVYCEAEEYFPTQIEWVSEWQNVSAISDPLERQRRLAETGFQSSGVGAIYTSRQHPGRNEGPLPTRVLAVPNFGLDRVKAMIGVACDAFDDANVTWFVGKPPNQTKDGWRMDALCDLYGISADAILVSTRAYAEILRAFEETYQDAFGEEHLVIATAGSKMQHIATSIFLRMRPEVGLVLCEPKEYNSARFSTGLGPMWSLHLGNAQELESAISQIGRLEFSW